MLKMTAQDGEWNQVSRKRGRLRNVPTPKLKEAEPTAAELISYLAVGRSGGAKRTKGLVLLAFGIANAVRERAGAGSWLDDRS